MLTRQGWILAAGAVALFGAGRLFGIFELHLLAAAAAVLVVGAVAVVRLTTLRLDVSRDLHPPRVHAGSPSQVQVRVTNRGRRTTPLLTLRDQVGEGRSARVLLTPLEGGQAVRAAYHLPTDHRGAVIVGPLEVEVGDPFGLATLATRAAPVIELTVWPAVDDVTPLPHTQGAEPHGGVDRPNSPRASGQDFYALRPYVLGDDLRRVHWRSTAKRDELMVRQDETPWQGRATVLLDARRGAYGGAAFERAVAAAASIVVAANRQRSLVRLVTSAGLDSGFGAGGSHVESILEHLSLVQPGAGGTLAGVLGTVRRAGNGGAIAALVGGRAPGDVAAAGRLRTTYGHCTVVAFAAGRDDRGAFGPGVAVVDDTHPFAPAWELAMGTGQVSRPEGATSKPAAASPGAGVGAAR